MIREKAWQVPRMWEDSDVWIIGGGPSLLSCFDIPSPIVDAVRTRKLKIDAYSPYLAALHSKHVIGINVAYQFGNWIDLCYFGDPEFYLGNMEGLHAFRKLVVTSSAFIGKRGLPWIKYLPCEVKKDAPTKETSYGISTKPNRICWNGNSGAAAISIAAWAGAKRVILVGFDMTTDSITNEQHFHNNYREKGKVQDRKLLPFGVHLRPWGVIKKDADNMGIEILNTSLISEIKEIPKVHIKELL